MALRGLVVSIPWKLPIERYEKGSATGCWGDRDTHLLPVVKAVVARCLDWPGLAQGGGVASGFGWPREDIRYRQCRGLTFVASIVCDAG